jgi:hypothetical protein
MTVGEILKAIWEKKGVRITGVQVRSVLNRLDRKGEVVKKNPAFEGFLVTWRKV